MKKDFWIHKANKRWWKYIIPQILNTISRDKQDPLICQWLWFGFSIPPPVEVGQVYIDMEWNDTELIINKLSNNKKSCRYMFTKVKGKMTDSPTECDMKVHALTKLYKLK